MVNETKIAPEASESSLFIEEVKNVEQTVKEDIKGVEAEVQDIEKGINRVKKLMASLNLARSCVLRFTNHTSKDLQLFNSQHTRGGFSEFPSALVKAGTTVEFGSQSNSWLVGTGTKGEVTYMSEGLKIKLDWNNPFFKSNSSGASLEGQNAQKFRLVSTTGQGCKQALVCYDLFETSE